MLACFVKKEYLKTGHHRHRFCLFLVFFKQTLQFLQQINVKKYPSSVRCWDLNPQPSHNELHSITIRTGLPHTVARIFGVIEMKQRTTANTLMSTLTYLIVGSSCL